MTASDKILSPITQKEECELIERMDTNRIINQYSKELNIDVRRFFETSLLNLYECPVTGYRFFDPSSSMGDGQFYENLEVISKGSYYPQKKWEYIKALEYVKPQNSVLEIGCGDGAFIRMCKQKGVQQMTGLELNEKVVNELRHAGVDAHNITIENFALQGKRFDVVCSFQVLEHVYDVHSFLSAAINSLNENGLLIIGVPNSHPYMFGSDLYNTLNMPPHHIGLWNKGSMEKTGAILNLKVVDMEIAPFEEYKNWFLYQRTRLIEKNKIYSILNLIPRPVYKLMVRTFASSIEGNTFLTVFKKN